MDATEVLFKLAEAAGIEDFYWDMHGERHQTSAETKRRLLKAFRIPVDTEEEARASLENFWRSPWMRLLPPVVVLTEGEPVLIPLRAWEEEGDRTINWQLVLEDGEPSAGVCRLGELPYDDIAYFDDKRIFQHRLKLDALPLGYHRFSVEGKSTKIIVAPKRCYLPEKLASHKVWGLMLQLYSLKSQRDWGVGDFGDLKLLTEVVGRAGGDAIGLNPLHALFPNTPENASPYSPCSRLFRNPLYLDIPNIADFAECPEAQELVDSEQYRIAIANSAEQELVNYTAVVMLKLPALELLYKSFVARHLEKNDERARSFQAYVAEKGDALAGIAEFYTLIEEFGTQDWSQWPDDERLREPDAIARLRRDRADRIGFQCYLQWQCELQFRDAAEYAKTAGLAVGLYNDLAVSVDASSADHWTHQSLFASGVRVGAPPDPFNEKGQDWGIVPLSPLMMRETAYAYFRKLLSSNMRHAGALRIDHVMGLTRLFLIPPGSTAASGAYVRYPLTELLAVVALESQRNKCMVIGEDLGTVPAGFRERLGDAGVLSSRVLYFERTEAGFKPPEAYPRLAAVSVSTHDLATLSGFWAGDDLKAKDRLGLFKDEKEEVSAKELRAEDRHHLLASLAAQGVLPKDVSLEKQDVMWTPELTNAVHAYLGQAPSTLFMVQLDDLVGQVHQANLPGSIFEYPNWRRRLTRPLEALLKDARFTEAMNALGKARS